MRNYYFIVLSIMTIIVEAFIFHMLSSNILTFKFKDKYNFLSTGSIFLLLLLNNFLSDILDSVSLNFLIKAGVYLAFSLIIIVFYSNPIREKILCFFVYFLVLGLGELFTVLLVFIFGNVSVKKLLENNYIYTLVVIVSKIFSIFFTEIIIKTKTQKLLIHTSYFKEICILVITDMILFIGSLNLLYNNAWLVKNVNLCFIIIISIIFFISILTLILIYKLSRKSQIEMENQLKMQQIELENKLNSDMEGIIESLRSLRHDMNNHVGIIKGLIKSKQYEDLDKYIDDIYKDIDSANDFIFLKNKALSVLLNSKISKSKQYNINFENFISINEMLIPDKDICSLLGNILDNAIEATSKLDDDKYIQLTIKQKDNHYIIICENNFKEKPQVFNGKFITSKENTFKLHGIGISNIKSIVKKYNGTMDINFNDVFTIKIDLYVKD